MNLTENANIVSENKTLASDDYSISHASSTLVEDKDVDFNEVEYSEDSSSTDDDEGNDIDMKIELQSLFPINTNNSGTFSQTRKVSKHELMFCKFIKIFHKHKKFDVSSHTLIVRINVDIKTLCY